MKAAIPDRETCHLVPISSTAEVDRFSAETERRLKCALDAQKDGHCDTIEVIGYSNDSGQRMANWLKERGVPERKVRVFPVSAHDTEALDTFNELLKLMRTLGREAFIVRKSENGTET